MASTPHEVVIVLDCADPESLAIFWADALGYEVKGTMDAYAMVAPAPGMSGVRLLLQGVEEPKGVKNRMHIDLHANDLAEEVARLVELGARCIEGETRSLGRTQWQVMADPEGNEFCVCVAT